MIWLALFLAGADQSAVSRGEKIFAQSCSVGYCHGMAGAAARGPRLRGRTFAKDYLYKATRDGIPKSAMPGWKERLKDDEIWAVVEYIQSLSAGGALETAPAATPAPGPSVAQAPAHPGQALFVERCGGCHAAAGKGTAVGPSISRVTAMPAGAPKQVQIVKLKDGETFPAVVVSREEGFVQVYDLTSPPPVKRTLESAEIASITAAASWPHPAAPTPEELASIIGYLRAAP
ncbi:MAG: c-type cytochrome [Candidatus Solibacter usitatus]|nr:c-type cytochrome [Candidatus Solibacter usitatus]